MDRYNLKQTLSSYLVALDELQNGDQVNPSVAIAEAGSLLRHLSVSFLCVMPTDVLNSFREEVDLAIHSTALESGFRVSIVTGNLEQWKNAIENCSSARASTVMRTLANKFMACFESLGLGEIWAKFSRTPMPDQTFRLTQK